MHVYGNPSYRRESWTPTYMRGSGTDLGNEGCVTFSAKDRARHLGLQRGRGPLQGDEKSRCPASEVCPALQIGQKKLFPVITLILVKVPNLNSSR